ncbi:MAG TPA: META domain-containing protein [Thermoanaerobaculia bacterium]|nr:META domain-containing protein [Thermoanaerobaculia bacterium]
MRRTSFLLLFLLAACATQDTAASLDGTNWTLNTSSAITLRFADGSATGSGGCNQYRATYTESGSSLTFGPIGATKRACVDPEGNRRESEYFDALSRVASYAISGNRLTLRDAAGTTLLEFTRA